MVREENFKKFVCKDKELYFRKSHVPYNYKESRKSWEE